MGTYARAGAIYAPIHVRTYRSVSPTVPPSLRPSSPVRGNTRSYARSNAT